MTLDKSIQITEQNWPSGTAPVLSVFNWVYNHKDFIRESIESILIQKTTFPVEIIIHDDASNDGTKEIILEYQVKHPQLFRNILHDENQWSQGKSVMTPLFEKPRGKYIALTHGDDYWTDPLKLQKQVDFLEKNPENSACAHLTKVIYENKEESHLYKHFEKQLLNIVDFSGPPPYHTSSVVFRNCVLVDFIFPKNILSGDKYLAILLSLKGNVSILNESMSVYRRNSESVSQNLKISSIQNDLEIGRWIKKHHKKIPIDDYYAHLYKSFLLYLSKYGFLIFIKNFTLYIFFSLKVSLKNMKYILKDRVLFKVLKLKKIKGI